MSPNFAHLRPYDEQLFRLGSLAERYFLDDPSWGKTCKMRVVEQFDVPMSDALVTIGATEQQSINEGFTSLKDIKNNGMSYNWDIRGKKVSGYCNVNGKGKITEFKQGL